MAQPAIAHTTVQCSLCGNNQLTLFHADKQRSYMRCPICQLVSVPDAYLLDPVAEKKYYDLHRNSANDPGYCNFLSRLLQALLPQLTPGMSGLDFGCGPTPVLADLLIQQGFCMAIFDPYYFTDTSVLQTRYDFITCTEVVEHAYEARKIWERLFTVLKPGGWLGIMTKRVLDEAAFRRWHYKNDPTHVRFYSEQTFCWIAHQWQTVPLFPASDVVLIQKPLSCAQTMDDTYGTY